MDMYQKREMRKNKKMNENTKSLSSTSINWYPGHMAKTKRLISENLKYIDIVYELVDCRIPCSSKLNDIDAYVQDKPKILIMTKFDLCDKKETLKWKEFYEKNGYTVFLCTKDTNINDLIKLTDNILKGKNLKRKYRALAIGVPNVGKSTLINKLAGKKVTNVGNKPGVTKDLNWIRVNDKLELLDSPGILWPKLNENAFNLASFTAIKEEILPLYDVVEYILTTLSKYYSDILYKRYGVSEVNEDFILTLEEIGKKRGCLVKGGNIDLDKTVNLIINDVKNGLISGITFDRIDV